MDINKYLDFGIYIREISIPDDAKIYVEENKFKTDRIIFGEKYLIEDYPKWNEYEFCKEMSKEDNLIKYIKIKEIIE